MGHVHRRHFTLAAGALLAGRLSLAQPAGRTYRVAIVATGPFVATFAGATPFLDELRALGYVEGRNLIVERRSAEGHPERYQQIVEEVVRLKPDAIILPGDKELIRAARARTNTIPIVLLGYNRAVEDGFVASLARPGGNVTGLASYPPSDFGPKMLQLFKEAVPGLRSVAVLGGIVNYEIAGYMVEAAAALGMKLLPVAPHPTDPEDSFARVAQLRADGLLISLGAINYVHRKQLGSLAYAARLPSISLYAETVEAGGLMSYSSPPRYGQVAHYIDKILKGANPGDLPMERPTKFELVINLKTAKAIGIRIPQSVLLRADRLIE